jgi:ketosteroid isomerase-like protein
VTDSANVELVREWVAFLPDLRDLDATALVDRAFRDYLDEDFELWTPAGYPEGESRFRGREGVGQFAAMQRDTWSEWRLEVERLLDAGDKVVVLARSIARGRGSGVPIEQPGAAVVTLRDGRITSVRNYRDSSEALKAVGLET